MRDSVARVRGVATGIAAAVALLWIGAVFGLNGAQWDWWRWASFAGAALSLVVAVLRPTMRVPSIAVASVGAAGAAILGASLAVMAVRYSDPYGGRLFWPHALAVFGVIGFALAAIAAAASSVTSR